MNWRSHTVTLEGKKPKPSPMTIEPKGCWSSATKSIVPRKIQNEFNRILITDGRPRRRWLIGDIVITERQDLLPNRWSFPRWVGPTTSQNWEHHERSSNSIGFRVPAYPGSEYDRIVMGSFVAQEKFPIASRGRARGATGGQGRGVSPVVKNAKRRQRETGVLCLDGRAGPNRGRPFFFFGDWTIRISFLILPFD